VAFIARPFFSFKIFPRYFTLARGAFAGFKASKCLLQGVLCGPFSRCVHCQSEKEIMSKVRFCIFALPIVKSRNIQGIENVLPL
jgi:hypothetical protein